MYCGQTVGRIKMKLGTQVGLGPGHSVLGGDPASASPKGGAEPPIFGTYPLWSNGWMDQDATWYGSRPRPRRLCVRWGPRSPAQKGGRAPQILSPCLLWPNGWMDQYETWHADRHRPWPHCVRWGPSSPSPKGGQTAELPPIFWPNGWIDQDATWWGGRPQPRRFYVRWGPPPPQKGDGAPLPNFRPISIVAKRLDASRCHLVWM